MGSDAWLAFGGGDFHGNTLGVRDVQREMSSSGRVCEEILQGRW